MSKGRALVDEIYKIVKNDILMCKYDQGRVLQEAEIAERFGTSKTPAREALGRLCQEGLVEGIPYKGYLITTPTIREWQDLLEVRIILETAIAELAVRRIRGPEIDRLAELAQFVVPAAGGQGLIDANLANRRFHVAVAEATKNRRLAAMVGNVLDLSQRLLFDDLNYLDPGSMVAEHKQLVEALKKKDGALARKLMLTHLEATRTRVLHGQDSVDEER